MREIVLDTETTGLDPNSGHRIVEIGCIEMVNQLRTGKSYHVYINPERDMPDEAYRVHGISEEFLKDKPVFAQEVDNFMEFIGDAKMVIHNAGFDMKFINAEVTRLGFKAYPMSQSIDTVAIARKKFPGSPASLDALCKRFVIDLSAREKHGALLDAELLADVYIELLGGKQVKLELGREDVKETSQVRAIADVTGKQVIDAREFLIAEVEKRNHEELVGEIKNAIWNQYSS